MDKELKFNDFPEDVKINPKKIAAEEDQVVMKNPVQVKLNEGGGAFHEKKAKNTKENWGGPSKRKAPKKFGANRAQQKAISKSKRNKIKNSQIGSFLFLLKVELIIFQRFFKLVKFIFFLHFCRYTL
jgi:hypothetical protein